MPSPPLEQEGSSPTHELMQSHTVLTPNALWIRSTALTAQDVEFPFVHLHTSISRLSPEGLTHLQPVPETSYPAVHLTSFPWILTNCIQFIGSACQLKIIYVCYFFELLSVCWSLETYEELQAASLVSLPVFFYQETKFMVCLQLFFPFKKTPDFPFTFLRR